MPPHRARITLRLSSQGDKRCELCKSHFVVPSPSPENEPSPGRCTPCLRFEKCSKCRGVKERDLFEKERGRPDQLYKTCADCRAKATQGLRQKITEAEVVGEYMRVLFVIYPLRTGKGRRYCSLGKHQVSEQDCISDNGTIQATCRVCLTRRKNKRHADHEAAATVAALRDRELRLGAEQTLHVGDAEGVQGAEIEGFDDVFGDGTDLMNVDLPDDSALSQQEAALLTKLNKTLDEIEYKSCDDCLEEGFDLSLNGTACSRCCHDTGDPVRKWSAVNNVHPGKPFGEPPPPSLSLSVSGGS
jgi:hypothetical protein